MELTFSDTIPMTRVINGRNSFNKGYHHELKGKTYEEYYGEETAKRMRKIKSEKLKGHKFWSNADAAAKKVVAIYNGEIVAMFSSAKKASLAIGVNYTTMRRYLKRKSNPKNKWLWFYEKDNTWYDYLK